MHPRFLVLLALLALVLAPPLVHADDDAPTSPPVAVEEEEEPAAPAADDDASSEPEIQIVSPGAEPRVRLRYHPPVGQRETIETTMNIDQATRVAGQAQPSPGMPPMKMVFNLEVVEIAEDGDVTFNMKVEDMGFDVDETDPNYNPMMAEAMKQAVEPLTALAFRMTVSDRGIPVGVEIEGEDELYGPAAQMFGQMRSSMTRQAMPMPAEPIGVGGKWRVRETQSAGGWDIDQTAVYEVKKIEGDVVHLAVTIEQTADDQMVDTETGMPGLPPGSTVVIQKHRGQGSGEGAYDMTMLSPVDVRMTMKSDTTMKMDMMGQSMAIDTTTNMKMRLAGKRVAKAPVTPSEDR